MFGLRLRLPLRRVTNISATADLGFPVALAVGETVILLQPPLL